MAETAIVWTDPAREDLDRVIAFLEASWSPETAIRFVSNFYDTLDLIAKYPEIGVRTSANQLIRRVRIDIYNGLYYVLRPDALYLLRIIDTRSNLADNPFDQ